MKIFNQNIDSTRILVLLKLFFFPPPPICIWFINTGYLLRNRWYTHSMTRIIGLKFDFWFIIKIKTENKTWKTTKFVRNTSKDWNAQFFFSSLQTFKFPFHSGNNAQFYLIRQIRPLKNPITRNESRNIPYVRS